MEGFDIVHGDLDGDGLLSLHDVVTFTGWNSIGEFVFKIFYISAGPDLVAGAGQLVKRPHDPEPGDALPSGRHRQGAAEPLRDDG
ncbi:hypothetical protein [Mangrovicoccus ximenensis]|uniref:hypothetical protein n=1 Tax=Mangrovicoccus ximenensis TaxID=1911570 RepID=UPI0011AE2E54|nr:hypothetical protein [Mangrovicoccus ximenensis]